MINFLIYWDREFLYLSSLKYNGTQIQSNVKLSDSIDEYYLWVTVQEIMTVLPVFKMEQTSRWYIHICCFIAMSAVNSCSRRLRQHIICRILSVVVNADNQGCSRQMSMLLSCPLMKTT